MEKYIKAPLEKRNRKKHCVPEIMYISQEQFIQHVMQRIKEWMRHCGKEKNFRFRSKMRLSIIWDRLRRERDG